MALITCIECGKKFSDKAPACPNCGCPMDEMTALEEVSIEEKFVAPKEFYSKDKKAVNAAIERGIISSPDDLIISYGKYYDGKFLSISYILFVTKEKFYVCKLEHVKRELDIIIPLEYTEESLEKFNFNIEKNKFEGDKKLFTFNPKSLYEFEKDDIMYTAWLEIVKRINIEKAEFFYNAKILKKPYCPKCNSFNVNFDLQSTSADSIGSSELRKKSLVTRTGNTVGRGAMIIATGGLWTLTPKKSKYKEKKKEKTKIENKTFAVCQECGNSWDV
jgi:hypothetical protein